MDGNYTFPFYKRCLSENVYKNISLKNPKTLKENIKKISPASNF